MANVAVTGETLAGAALTTTDTVSAPAEGRAVIGAAGSVLFASDTVLWPEAVFGGIAYANPTSNESAKLLAETRFEAELDITVIPSLSGLVQTHFVAAAQISVPDLAPTVKLGCGLYEVWVLERGGKAIRSLPDVVSINFNRVLNGVSEASVVVGVPVGRVLTEEACRAVADLNPWSHEIAIYRGIDEPQLVILGRDIGPTQLSMTHS